MTGLHVFTIRCLIITGFRVNFVRELTPVAGNGDMKVGRPQTMDLYHSAISMSIEDAIRRVYAKSIRGQRKPLQLIIIVKGELDVISNNSTKDMGYAKLGTSIHVPLYCVRKIISPILLSPFVLLEHLPRRKRADKLCVFCFGRCAHSVTSTIL